MTSVVLVGDTAKSRENEFYDIVNVRCALTRASRVLRKKETYKYKYKCK